MLILCCDGELLLQSWWLMTGEFRSIAAGGIIVAWTALSATSRTHEDYKIVVYF